MDTGRATSGSPLAARPLHHSGHDFNAALADLTVLPQPSPTASWSLQSPPADLPHCPLREFVRASGWADVRLAALDRRLQP